MDHVHDGHAGYEVGEGHAPADDEEHSGVLVAAVEDRVPLCSHIPYHGANYVEKKRVEKVHGANEEEHAFCAAYESCPAAREALLELVVLR